MGDGVRVGGVWAGAAGLDCALVARGRHRRAMAMAGAESEGAASEGAANAGWPRLRASGAWEASTGDGDGDGERGERWRGE